MKQFTIPLGAIAIVTLLYNSLFVVDQRLSAIVFQFGEAVRVIETPGLKMKIPFIQNIDFYEKRLIGINAKEKELIASDGKRVIVDAFAKFKIVDPVVFYKKVNNYRNVKVRLDKILESSMRKSIGKNTLIDLLSEKRGAIMSSIHKMVDTKAQSFGVKVVDVRIKKTDLPRENSDSIYKRMRAEREKEAKRIRAEGEEEYSKITSEADKDTKIILAQAYKKGQELKGEGDAVAAAIYNKAYSKDPKFYSFYRSLTAYRKSFKEGTSFIMSPDNEFLKYLKLGRK